MKYLKSILLIILSIVPLTGWSRQPSLNDGYRKGVFEDTRRRRMPYRILEPQRVMDNARYPLVVFLHGYGERGKDNEKQLTYGASLFTNPANSETYPAYVLFPQTARMWTGDIRPRDFMPGSKVPEESDDEQTLMELVRKVMDEYPVDARRVYLVGLSMGGVCAYDLACRYPEVFAAAVPICGAVNPDRLKDAKGVNFMIFHGDMDEEVPAVASREAFKTLDALGATVKYVEFAGVGHECWSFAFNSACFLPWLFDQSKPALPSDESYADLQ